MEVGSHSGVDAPVPPSCPATHMHGHGKPAPGRRSRSKDLGTRHRVFGEFSAHLPWQAWKRRIALKDVCLAVRRDLKLPLNADASADEIGGYYFALTSRFLGALDQIWQSRRTYILPKGTRTAHRGWGLIQFSVQSPLYRLLQ